MEFQVRLLGHAEEFIRNLPSKLEAKSLRAITMLRQFGYALHEPHSKTLRDAEGLKELRIQVGTDICRLFYFHYKSIVYVITSGYVKKEQQTSRKEIDRALQLKRDFIKEHEYENS